MTFDEQLEQIRERHQALANTLELLAHMHLEAEKANREAREANLEAEKANREAREANLEAHKRFDEEHAKTERTLRRAIRMGVVEARRQRVRSRELDAQISRTEAVVQSFIESLRRGNNGGSSKLDNGR